EKQASHNGLPSTGVVGEKESDARQAHKVVVDGFELVRQRIYTRDGERKIWVMLVREPETGRLDAKAEARRIAVEGLARGRRIKELKLIEAQDPLVYLSGLLARAYNFEHIAKWRDHKHFDGFRKHRPSDDRSLLEFTDVH